MTVGTDPSEMFVGIDVGGSRKGFDIALISATGDKLALVDLDKVDTVGKVVSLLVPHAPKVIAIDSPCGPASKGSKSRSCERELAAMICGIRYTPDSAALSERLAYYEWIENGLKLYTALARATFREVIEVFPTASWTRLGGSRVGSRARWTRRLLSEVLEEEHEFTGIPDRHNQDVRDAIVAAYTGWLHHSGRSDTSFWPIVVPA